MDKRKFIVRIHILTFGSYPLRGYYAFWCHFYYFSFKSLGELYYKRHAPIEYSSRTWAALLRFFLSSFIFTFSSQAENWVYINPTGAIFFLKDELVENFLLYFFEIFLRHLIFLQIRGWFDITTYCLNPYSMNSKL